MTGRTDPVMITTPQDLITQGGLDAKAAVRITTRAGRYLQARFGDRIWYDRALMEPVSLLFRSASDLRHSHGLVGD